MSSAMCPSKQDRLLIRAEKDMEFTSALTAFSFLPGEGVFTVESDRQVVASVVASKHYTKTPKDNTKLQKNNTKH